MNCAKPHVTGTPKKETRVASGRVGSPPSRQISHGNRGVSVGDEVGLSVGSGVGTGVGSGVGAGVGTGVGPVKANREKNTERMIVLAY